MHWRLVTSQHGTLFPALQTWACKVGKTQSEQFLAAPPAYLVYPLYLPVYGQIIQGGSGGALMSWHVHADQVQVLWKELGTQRCRQSGWGIQDTSVHSSREVAPTYQVTWAAIPKDVGL